MNKYERFVVNTFQKLPEWATGIETECFFKMAEKAKLYVPGTYGTPISQAIEKYCNVKTVSKEDGSFLFNTFILKEGVK